MKLAEVQKRLRRILIDLDDVAAELELRGFDERVSKLDQAETLIGPVANDFLDDLPEGILVTV